MLLLITSSQEAQGCAAALAKATGERVQVVETLPAAAGILRGMDFAAVVLDQALYDAAPTEAEAAMRHAGPAVPLLLNFAISGVPRVVSEVRSALHRSRRELLEARRAAASELRGQLMEAVTGILLSSELALQEPNVPAAAQERLRSVRQLATGMRSQLERER